MQLIHTLPVHTRGAAGVVGAVADGYGNTFLMPRGLAMRATKGALADAEAISRARRTREARSVAEAEERRAELERRPVTVQANAGEDGTLYGSIGTTVIAKAVSDQLGLSIDRRKIMLDKPLKELGEHQVGVRIHADVRAALRVVVARS
jgi:large subunit ribosomal protein L9